MAFNRQLIAQKDEVNKFKNIGSKIATYRLCANIPFNIFAERTHVGVEVLDAIEKGIYKDMTIELVLRFAENLGVTYADLYEADNERYYNNVKDEAAFKFIFKKMQEYGYAELADKIDLKINFIYSAKHKNYIPSPFILGNIMTLLKINSVDFRNAGVYDEKPAVEAPKETPTAAPDVDALNEVIKAVNVYKNVDTLKAELNEIINKAQNLINLLGA